MLGKKFFCSTLLIALVVALFANVGYGSPAEVNYPTRAITLTLAQGVGGGTDAATRAIQPALSEALGVTVIVENKPGSNGWLAALDVFNSPADGYKILVTPITIAYTPKIFGEEGVELKHHSQLVPIGSWMNGDAEAFCVTLDSPYKTMDEFAQAHVGKKVTVAVAGGVGGSGHLVLLAISQAYNLDLEFVPYNSAGEAAAALMGKHMDAGILSYSGEAITQDNLKFLAVSAREPWQGVPTFADLGHPEITVPFMIGALGPTDLDPRIVEILDNAFEKAFNGEIYQKWGASKPIGEYLNSQAWGQAIQSFETVVDPFIDVIKAGIQ